MKIYIELSVDGNVCRDVCKKNRNVIYSVKEWKQSSYFMLEDALPGDFRNLPVWTFNALPDVTDWENKDDVITRRI